MTNCTEEYQSHENYAKNSLNNIKYSICKDPVFIIPFVFFMFIIFWILSSCCCNNKKHGKYSRP